VLLIVMYEARTWHVRPGEKFTFGRAAACSAVLSASDRGLSRSAGSFRFHDGVWWLHNDSASSLLQVLGDRGLRVDLPPGLRTPLQQWRAKVQLSGVLGTYILRLRLPDLDDLPSSPGAGGAHATGGADMAAEPGGAAPTRAVSSVTGDRAVTSTQYRVRLSDSDRLVLAARFEQYLTWRHPGAPTPRTAREAAERIGWQPHAVTKRCENIRDRYSRLGVPGLRGSHALEELAALLISTGELTADDLRRLPADRPSA
jgi:hypothetical protein